MHSEKTEGASKNRQSRDTDLQWVHNTQDDDKQTNKQKHKEKTHRKLKIYGHLGEPRDSNGKTIPVSYKKPTLLLI